MIWLALFADKVEYVNKGVPILQGKHITSGKIDYKDVRYLDKEKYEPIYYPKYVFSLITHIPIKKITSPILSFKRY